ncbi:ribosome small subunit-dependent GTPase A [Actinomadura xylanilytica]|uniref:ribosome small subunit-dependent GTPase A n=1 Tax=Actinomadura xylanilytica TaxID=887459 RepID=UPI00255ACB78|nr:ribosome small subunit-dependent GTPase A [Actinomadura xylanilytica]MDL4771997.1 ribosome small subunit-dependent GTPase A [Actinomadura xylanilytica]
MARKVGDYDEDDVRVRPGRRGSRPRTRRRPAHDDAVAGFVTAVDRGRYRCLVGDRPVTAMRARELGRKGVVVGDRVALVGDSSGRPDTLARIVRVEPRTSSLRRTADDTDPFERIIVANADQLVIVTALADPEPRPRMIDRQLVAAYDAGMDPLLCLTKADLAGPDDLVAAYAPLGVRYVVTRHGGDLDGPREHLAGRTSVLVGHSGVGKSTLVNALVPDAERAVSHVNAVTGRGRHTSSSALALALPGGGWIIDTPGVRSFGLAHVKPENVINAFEDLAEGAAERCPPMCDHLPPGSLRSGPADSDSPGERPPDPRQTAGRSSLRSGPSDCGLDGWVAEGHASQARLDSLRRLLTAREGEPE